MDAITKIIIGAVVGAVVTGISFSIACYFIEKALPPSSDWGISLTVNWLVAILLAVHAAPFGGVLGAVIAALQLNIVTGTFAGFVFGLVVSCAFFFQNGGGLDKFTTYFSCSIIAVGTLVGAVVALVNSRQLSLK